MADTQDMAKPIRTLTEQEFNQTIVHLRLSRENVAITSKILVQGVPISLVAKEVENKGKQTIEKATKRVWDKFLELQDIPKDWVSIRVCLPLEEAVQVKNRERELRQQLIKANIIKLSDS